VEPRAAHAIAQAIEPAVDGLVQMVNALVTVAGWSDSDQDA